MATVSTNSSPDVAIGGDEIDRWLTRFENGILPAGPPAHLRGLLKGAQSNATAELEAVCISCYLQVAEPSAMRLYYSDLDPGTTSLVWNQKSDAAQTPESLLGVTKCGDGCAEEKAACVQDFSEFFFRMSVYRAYGQPEWIGDVRDSMKELDFRGGSHGGFQY